MHILKRNIMYRKITLILLLYFDFPFLKMKFSKRYLLPAPYIFAVVTFLNVAYLMFLQFVTPTTAGYFSIAIWYHFIQMILLQALEVISIAILHEVLLSILCDNKNICDKEEKINDSDALLEQNL